MNDHSKDHFHQSFSISRLNVCCELWQKETFWRLAQPKVTWNKVCPTDWNKRKTNWGRSFGKQTRNEKNNSNFEKTNTRKWKEPFSDYFSQTLDSVCLKIKAAVHFRKIETSWNVQLFFFNGALNTLEQIIWNIILNLKIFSYFSCNTTSKKIFLKLKLLMVRTSKFLE